MKVTIVDYSSGNISSVVNSFKEVAQNKAKIEVRDASDNGGDFIFYIHEQNENADDTLKELMFLKSDKTVDICGNLNIQNGTFSGIVNSNSLICNNIGILHDNPAVELDISGVGAIRIPLSLIHI